MPDPMPQVSPDDGDSPPVVEGPLSPRPDASPLFDVPDGWTARESGPGDEVDGEADDESWVDI